MQVNPLFIMSNKMKHQKWLLKLSTKRNLIFLILFACFVYYFHKKFVLASDEVLDGFGEDEDDINVDSYLSHLFKVEDYYSARNDVQMPLLGNIMYQNLEPPIGREKIYKILIWRQGQFLEARHIYSFTETRTEPFSHCSVSNCELSYNDKDVSNADAIVFWLQRLNGLEDLPEYNATRPPGQRWIFLTDESPKHTFIGNSNWKQFEGIFNWSMTYRMESDVPVPYGRTTPLEIPIDLPENLDFTDTFNLLVPNGATKRRDVLVAVMMSNCHSSNERLKYVKELQDFITVDIYGECGTEFKFECPKRGVGKDSRYGGQCPQLDRYAFYLSFENANCEQYISEKPFYNAYRTGAVPIIMGPPDEDCRIQLPPKSYIHVNDFLSPQELSEHLLFLNSTWEENYLSLHYWRKNFEVKNEHGMFGAPSFHYCRVCEALNYNSEEPKVYNDLSYFLDPIINCN